MVSRAHGVAVLEHVFLKPGNDEGGRHVSAPFIVLIMELNGNERHQSPNLCRGDGFLDECWGISVSMSREAYLGLPDLSPAVLSTRDHRGADLALPRHAVNSTVPLGNSVERMISSY